MPLNYLPKPEKKVILAIASNLLCVIVVATIVFAFSIMPAMGTAKSSTTVLVIAFALLFVVTRSFWRGKTSATLAVAIFCIVFIAVIALHLDLNFYDAITRYKAVIELLIGIGLMRIVFTRADLEGPLGALLGSVKPQWRSFVLTSVVCILALPLSLATVAIVCSLLKDITRPQRAVAVVTMRAVCTTMLLIPTTIASAAVSVSLPSLDPVNLIYTGIPLFVIAFLGCCFQKMEFERKATVEKRIKAKSIGVIAAFWGLFGLFSLVLHLNLIEALALSGILLFVLDSLVFNKRDAMTVLTETRGALGSTSPEMMLLLACGFLTVLLSQVTLPHTFVSILQKASSNPAISIALIVFVLPAISALGVHPLILFNVSFPLIDSSLFGNTSHQYLVWVTMFIAAQLVSPVSISAIMAAHSLSVNPSKTSFKIHTRYAVFFSACVWVYILLTR